MRVQNAPPPFCFPFSAKDSRVRQVEALAAAEEGVVHDLHLDPVVVRRLLAHDDDHLAVVDEHAVAHLHTKTRGRRRGTVAGHEEERRGE